LLSSSTLTHASVSNRLQPHQHDTLKSHSHDSLIQLIPQSRNSESIQDTLTPYANTDSYRIEGASRWFKYFDQVDNQQQLPKTNRAKRIKIAILDTGIDDKNSWIATKSGRFQCWPNNDACKDTDGHGTQVAYLLLRLAPHVHLRVAKVANTQLLNDADIKQIAAVSHISLRLCSQLKANTKQAICHFSALNEDSKPEDQVDIINMSFGFPRYEPRLKPILDAIRAARQKNILFFAAAGNDGGNQGIFWPARLHEQGDVICINSSDWEGNASKFNPTTGSNNCICTLGEALPSCELSAQNEIVHRSGTSFATPIAVATAAIVLGLVDADKPKGEEPQDFPFIKTQLRTKAGMEKILSTMCVLPGQKSRMGYAYITPWFFLSEIDAQSRMRILANELRSL
jgi:hypothetical protein